MAHPPEVTSDRGLVEPPRQDSNLRHRSRRPSGLSSPCSSSIPVVLIRASNPDGPSELPCFADSIAKTDWQRPMP
jgi:hypothetical protein